MIDRTEQRKAEEGLRASEKKYHALVDQSLLGVAIAQGTPPHFVYANPAMVRMSGYTPEELASVPFEKLVYPDDRERFFTRLKERFEGKNAVSPAEYRMMPKDGKVMWAELSSSFVDYNGKPAVQAAFIDITERKKTEEALRHSEERWRSLAESSPDHVMLLDLEFNILYINRTVPDLKREEVIGTSVFSYVPPERHRVAKDCFKRVIETGKTDHYDTEYRTKDGEVRYFDVRVGPVFQEDRVVALISSSTDVTSQKKAEEELRDSEEKYRSLFANMQNGFAYCKMIFDTKGKPIDFVYLDVNDAFEEITGLKNVVGKKVSEVMPRTGIVHPELFDIYGRVASTGKEKNFELFSKPLNIWLSVSAYSPKKRLLCCHI